MTIYLPIAELSLNLFFLVGIGAIVGFLSGMFGVGGGFLLTPLLIFVGVPTAVAIGSVTGQVVAASTSGALSYLRRLQVDIHLTAYLIASSIVGAPAGVAVFARLRGTGQLDIVISIGFFVLLSFVGTLMLIESSRSILLRRSGMVIRERLPSSHNWLHGLPWRVRFKRSRLYISAIPVLTIGLGVGFIGSLFGIGGGFILVPALVYLLRVPSAVVVGSSLLQVVAMMAATTFLYAVTSQSVDLLLALCLMVGGTVGAQFGAAAGRQLRADHLRALLALLIIAIALRFGLTLVMPPLDPYSIELASHG